MKTLQACPAYARRYTTQADMLKDWADGKDFKIVGGPYFSNRDIDLLKSQGYGQIEMSYGSFGNKLYIIHL